MKKKASNFKLLPSQKIKILTTKRLLWCLIFIERCIFLLACFLQRSQNFFEFLVLCCKSYLCKMEGNRQKKIVQLLQNDLGEIFRQISHTLQKGLLITVTKVRISPDLSYARVYLSVFPIADKAAVLKDIKILKPKIRKALSDRSGKQLRKTPDLSFFIDDSLDYIENIDRELTGKGNNPKL